MASNKPAFAKLSLFLKILSSIFRFISSALARSLTAPFYRLTYRPPRDGEPPRNILIIGASFAGYHAARVLSTTLPSGYRVVVVEPHSHFHFTWVFPRFSVIPGHESTAFIPYGGYLSGAHKGAVLWLRDAVVRLENGKAVLRSGAEDVPFEYALIATGASAAAPGRMGVDGKAEGVQVLRSFQDRIKKAQRVVVVGGGAVGVEVATDAKATYPEKTVTLVHSRAEVMNRFGRELRETARKALEELGVELILGERLSRDDKEEGAIVLNSGKRVPYDILIDSTGQKPASGFVAELSPSSIAESGHIKVKPTMQIEDDSLPNIYVAGDVAQTGSPNTNSRTAMDQATVAVDNILLAIKGRKPRVQYKPSWLDNSILLTLGLKKDAMCFTDGDTELLFNVKSKGPSMNSASAWRHMGAKPFVDEEYPEEKLLNRKADSAATNSAA